MNGLAQIALMILFVLPGHLVTAQNTKRVLFLGNSYTYANNLPQLVADMATSTGKNLIFDSHSPGGYYLAQHLTNDISLEKITAGNWNHVVLQDQSMALAYPSTFMNFLPYDIQLDSLIKANNSCVQTMFYATWGRKDGDSYWCTIPECATQTLISRTYFEMDSTIESHYKIFADSIKCPMTPVGATWRHIRQNYPSIELFDPDGSHPSLAGSYAAACAFYTTIFRSDPTFIEFNSSLSTSDALNIKNSVKQIVYDNLPHWNVGVYDDLLDENCLSSNIDNRSNNNPSWEVFPNPCTNIIHIKLLQENIPETISVYSINGVLMDRVLIEKTTSLSLVKYPEGIYFMKSSGSVKTYKVIKNE